MLRLESIIKEIRFELFPETGKIWGRMDIVRQIISKCGSIESKTVTEVFFRFVY